MLGRWGIDPPPPLPAPASSAQQTGTDTDQNSAAQRYVLSKHLFEGLYTFYGSISNSPKNIPDKFPTTWTQEHMALPPSNRPPRNLYYLCPRLEDFLQPSDDGATLQWETDVFTTRKQNVDINALPIWKYLKVHTPPVASVTGPLVERDFKLANARRVCRGRSHHSRHPTAPGPEDSRAISQASVAAVYNVSPDPIIDVLLGQDPAIQTAYVRQLKHPRQKSRRQKHQRQFDRAALSDFQGEAYSERGVDILPAGTRLQRRPAILLRPAAAVTTRDRGGDSDGQRSRSDHGISHHSQSESDPDRSTHGTDAYADLADADFENDDLLLSERDDLR